MSKIIDLTGKRFNMLTVIRQTDKREPSTRSVLWECLCDCGNICYKSCSALNQNKVYSCGCTRKPRKKETVSRVVKHKQSNRLVGQRFGRLVVLEYTEKRDSSRNIIWKCVCDCGNICYVSTKKLGKDTFSCGCLQKDNHIIQRSKISRTIIKRY